MCCLSHPLSLVQYQFPGIRQHLKTAIEDVYNDFDVSCTTFPGDDECDPDAYLLALDEFSPGDAVTIFTPDDTHYKIARAAVERGLHVLLTKPPVKVCTVKYIYNIIR